MSAFWQPILLTMVRQECDFTTTYAANVLDPDDYSLVFIYKIWQYSKL